MAGISAWPDVVDALLSACRDSEALADRVVVDGDEPEGDDVEHYLYIGLGDPRRDDSDAGKFDQTWNMSSSAGRRESGTVNCIAVSYDGSGDQRAARSGCFATLGAVQRILRADPRLSVDGVLSTSFTGGLPDQVQTSSGAVCAVRFQVDYEAQLKE